MARPMVTGVETTGDFRAVYERWFDFVWRSARRLGVAEASIDDVVQDVFVVVHRRLADFEGRSSLKTWIFGIVIRVVRDHRRSLRRKAGGEPLREGHLQTQEPSPIESLAQSEAVALLDALLDELDEEKREVFVLSELEQLTAPEIAAATKVNVNTVYSRLRSARSEFESALARHRSREGRRPSWAG